MDAADIVREFEPLRLRAGTDEAGNAVIGYAHRTKNLDPRASIDEVTAEILLMQDVARAERSLQGTVRRVLNENQRQAVISWMTCYHPGKIRGCKTLSLLNRGRLFEFADALLTWDWIADPAGQKVQCQRMKERREAERKLFLMPVVVSNNGRVMYA